MTRERQRKRNLLPFIPTIALILAVVGGLAVPALASPPAATTVTVAPTRLQVQPGDTSVQAMVSNLGKTTEKIYGVSSWPIGTVLTPRTFTLTPEQMQIVKVSIDWDNNPKPVSFTVAFYVKVPDALRGSGINVKGGAAATYVLNAPAWLAAHPQAVPQTQPVTQVPWKLALIVLAVGVTVLWLLIRKPKRIKAYGFLHR